MEKKTVHQKIEILDRKIDKRPTIVQAISFFLVGLTVIISILTWSLGRMLDANTNQLLAETKLTVVEAMIKHEKNDRLRWVEHKKLIITDILERLKIVRR